MNIKEYTSMLCWHFSRVFGLNLKLASSEDGFEKVLKSNLGFMNVGGQYSFSLRPVVSLKAEIKFEPDGDGTATSPYVVKYE